MSTDPVTLSRVVVVDDALYRAAQELLALAAIPGRRDLILRREGGRWRAVGHRPGVTEYPVAALPLASEESHRAHLDRARQSAPAVDATAAVSVLYDTYLIPAADTALLRGPTERLATALDAREGPPPLLPWRRRAQQDDANRRVRLALADLWEAAALVVLQRPS